MIDDPKIKPLVRDMLLSLMTARRIRTQSEFARSVKLSNGYVCDVLACRRNLSPKVVERIIAEYALTRVQAGALYHRAAQVAGWKLPSLPPDQQVHVFAPDPALVRVRTRAPKPGLPQARVRPKRKVVIVHAKRSTPKPAPKKKPPARVLPRKTATVRVSVDNAAPAPNLRLVPGTSRVGFVPPSLEDLTQDIEREIGDA